MLVQNPVRESYCSIREKYDGYCVLVVDCDREQMDFGMGTVVAFDAKLADLVGETLGFVEENELGFFAYRTFTPLGTAGTMQVVHHV